MIATRPKIASANSPNETTRTKKTPMIALNRVKTLPATMLEVERDEVGSAGPSCLRRAAASSLERPLSIAASVTPGMFTGSPIPCR